MMTSETSEQLVLKREIRITTVMDAPAISHFVQLRFPHNDFTATANQTAQQIHCFYCLFSRSGLALQHAAKRYYVLLANDKFVMNGHCYGATFVFADRLTVVPASELPR